MTDTSDHADADRPDGTPAFTLGALRTAVRQRGPRGPDTFLVPPVCETPLLDEIPDVWVAWAWGLGCRLLGEVGTPLVTHAAASGRAEGSLDALVRIVAQGQAASRLAGPPTAQPEDFVVGAFLATLGRAPSPDDLQHTRGLLDLHPHEAVLHALVLSDESRRVLRHPRPWQDHAAADRPRGSEPTGRRGRSLTALGSRLRAPEPGGGAPDEVVARLDVIADAQWRLARRATDDLRAVHAELAHLRERTVRSSGDDGPTLSALLRDERQAAGTWVGSYVLAEAGSLLRWLPEAGLVVAEVVEITVRSVTAGPADDSSHGPRLAATVVLDAFAPGASRAAVLATAVAGRGWTMLDAREPAADGAHVRVVLSRTFDA
jgi:hypothetical protein